MDLLGVMHVDNQLFILMPYGLMHYIRLRIYIHLCMHVCLHTGSHVPVLVVPLCRKS